MMKKKLLLLFVVVGVDGEENGNKKKG